MANQINHADRMTIIWNFVESWMQSNAPDLLTHLRPPATTAQIQATEAALNIPLSEEIKAFWSIHNGTENQLFGGWKFLSMQEIGQENRANQIGGWWPTTWIAFASDGCGDAICTDIDPALEDKQGQIIHFDHEMGSEVVAESLWILLSTFINDLKDGDYEVNERGEFVSDETSLLQ